MNCSKCGAAVPPGARYCENDGALITPELTADRQGFGVCRCGAAADAIDESGYCAACGVRRTVAAGGARDHIEISPSREFAGVTDRGLRHKENQDDIALRITTEPGSCCIAVLCDGVSGSEAAAAASSAAARAFCAAIEHASGESISEALIFSAIQQANQAVNQLPYLRSTPKDPPATTLVAAVMTGRTGVIGWAGDSRAYWFTDTEAAMLTRDHSWVNDIVAAGAMTEEEALRSPLAHAIVCSLGGGSESVDPTILTCRLPEGAHLLLCSDGLWNYAPEVDALMDVIRRERNETPLQTARRLTQYAVQQGGKDNVSVIILAV